MSSDQILKVSKGDSEIAQFITSLFQQIDTLELRVKELERQLNQNSNNSSKPPSSDGLRKPNNLRQPGGKKGAPEGHKGTTLSFSDHVDETIVHRLTTCVKCSAPLTNADVRGVERRQVFDLPAPRIIITEHQSEKSCCPHCQTLQQAPFPAGVHAPVQYGDGFAAWTAYFNVYQLLPLERISQLFGDLTGYRPSEATLLSYLADVSDAVAPHETTIREQLLDSAVAHADETGMRVEGKSHWVHTFSSDRWTLLSVQPSRGSIGMAAAGMIPDYKGYLVHDCYSTYFKDDYSFSHVLCNAHLLRECQGIIDSDNHLWAVEMKILLQEAWQAVRTAREENGRLSQEQIAAYELQYDGILSRGQTEWLQDEVPEKTGPKGRKCKSKAHNLGQRFLDYKGPILLFLHDARIPFDNNQAERDIRMVKLKSKISGTFRTVQGSRLFIRVRGFISTLRKQNRPVLSSLFTVIRGQFSF